jgi:hypothetical protein
MGTSPERQLLLLLLLRPGTCCGFFGDLGRGESSLPRRTVAGQNRNEVRYQAQRAVTQKLRLEVGGLVPEYRLELDNAAIMRLQVKVEEVVETVQLEEGEGRGLEFLLRSLSRCLREDARETTQAGMWRGEGRVSGGIGKGERSLTLYLSNTAVILLSFSCARSCVSLPMRSCRISISGGAALSPNATSILGGGELSHRNAVELVCRALLISILRPKGAPPGARHPLNLSSIVELKRCSL